MVEDYKQIKFPKSKSFVTDSNNYNTLFIEKKALKELIGKLKEKFENKK